MLLRRFLKDVGGNYVIMTSFLVLPLLAALALSVDYTEMTRQRNVTLQALDAAGPRPLRLPYRQDPVPGAPGDGDRQFRPRRQPGSGRAPVRTAGADPRPETLTVPHRQCVTEHPAPAQPVRARHQRPEIGHPHHPEP
jgi:hypothetical protein